METDTYIPWQVIREDSLLLGGKTGQLHVHMDLSHLQERRQLQAKRDILEVAKADEVVMRRPLLVDLSVDQEATSHGQTASNL